jgi:hypothetical protein
MDIKQAIRENNQEVIRDYWRKVLAPKYGYTKLIEPETGKVIIDLGKEK